jgi:hypothetical protein
VTAVQQDVLAPTENSAVPAKGEITTPIVLKEENVPMTPTPEPAASTAAPEEPHTSAISSPQPAPQAGAPLVPQSSDPVPGSVKYENGKEYGWLPGFGWVEYSGPNIVTYAEDMYENGNKIGIMGGSDSAPHRSSIPQTEEPPIFGEVFEQSNKPEGYVAPPKNSTPPPDRPNTVCLYE